MEAVGTENNGITFTSEADTDGSQWAGLYFNGGTGHLNYVTVRYGGDFISLNIKYANIYVENIRTGGELLIENSQILNAGTEAEPAYGMAIEAPELAQVRLLNNTFRGNQTNRIQVIEGTLVSDATLVPQTGLEGYEVDGQLTVGSQPTLTVEAGTTLMRRLQNFDNGNIRVEGHLEALGTAANPITFTSVVDTEGNQWGGLYFNGGSGHLNYVIVRYGGHEFFGTSSRVRANIYIEDVRTGQEVLIENSQILNAATEAEPAYGMAIEPTELPYVRLENNTFSGNQINRIQVIRGTVASEATLVPQTSLEGYELYGQLTVSSGITLTVKPGTTVMAHSFFDDHLLIQGHLKAVGTAANPIIFTSAVDTEGNQWGGLYFNGGSGQLNHVTVRYGGNRFSGVSSDVRANIYIEDVRTGQEVLIENSQILNAATEAEPAYGMAIEPTELPYVRLENNTFSGNQINRIQVIRGTVASEATLVPQTSLEGYELYGQLTVSSGITLTVKPGTTVMAHSFFDDHLLIQGHLKAVGTAANPIIFTSAVDTDRNQWGGLYFNGGSGHLNHVTVRYGGDYLSSDFQYANIYVEKIRAGGELLIENSQILNAGTEAEPAYGMAIEATELPQVRLENNTFSGNQINRIRVIEGMVGSDATLVPQTGLEGYELYGTVTVGTDATLTVEPGTTVMGRLESAFGADDHIQVVGHLKAVGTAANPILFTSAVNNDRNQWGGLYFNGGSGHLNHVTVRYGGNRFDGASSFLGANIYIEDVRADQEVLIENSQILNAGTEAEPAYGMLIEATE